MLIEFVEIRKDDISGFMLDQTFINPEHVISVDPYENGILREAMEKKSISREVKFSKIHLRDAGPKIIIGEFNTVSLKLDPKARKLLKG